MADCGNRKTLSFDETSKGWESFYTYYPDWMIGMNNKFFTFKNGELYLHDDQTAVVNTFYGVKSPSKITFFANTDSSDVKVFKTMELEGNDSWLATIKAFKSQSEDFDMSTIARVEFDKREGMWDAYIRRNEDTTSLVAKATYGIGVISDITGNVITVGNTNSQLCIGDSLMQDDLTIVGLITAIDGNELTISSVTGLVEGEFVIGVKNHRIEAGDLRGYTAEVTLENNSNNKLELYSVNINAFKSF